MESTWKVVTFDAQGEGEPAFEGLTAIGATLLMEMINERGGRAAIELEDRAGTQAEQD